MFGPAGYYPHPQWLVQEFFEEGFYCFQGDYGSDIDAGAEPADQFPHGFGIHILPPERVRLALFGFGGVDTASLIGQKRAGCAFFPHFYDPVTLIAGEEGFLKFCRRDFQKISGVADIFTVKIHDTRLDATLETIGLTFKPNRFLFPPFSHVEILKITI